MSLPGTIVQLLETAEKLKSSGGNEANTKALLIEPLLDALGWDTADLDHVEREFRVYDGTALDYALRLDGELRLFVEAKALAKQLDDKQFISQTVNYANNEGVVWCVLTNGVAWRVYKTNEPVAMDEKLLFEADVREAAEGASKEVAAALQLISRESIETGALDAWGEQVFTDKRVRGALVGLASKPPPQLVEVLQKALGKPAIPADALRDSLGRILDVGDGAAPPPTTTGKAKAPQKPPGPKKEFAIGHHLDGKPSGVVDLFEQVDEFARSLGTSVSRRIRKFYVGYFAGKRSFCTIEIQRQRLIVYLNLDPTTTTPWNEKSMRDVREIGHFGMGDTEFSLRAPEELGQVKTLIQQAFEASS